MRFTIGRGSRAHRFTRPSDRHGRRKMAEDMKQFLRLI